MLPTAKRAPQIIPSGIAGMTQKADPAVAADTHTATRLGMCRQDRVHGHLILLNKWFNTVVLVPILAEQENFRDGYGKKARFSVMILIGFCTSSSYLLDAKASRGRARIFYAFALKLAQVIRATDRHITGEPNRFS